MLFTQLYLFLQKNDDIAKYIANQLKQKTSKATKSKLEETNLMNGHAAGQKSGKFVTSNRIMFSDFSRFQTFFHSNNS